MIASTSQVVDGIERGLAQQPDGVDHLLGRPGGAGVGDRCAARPSGPAAIGSRRRWPRVGAGGAAGRRGRRARGGPGGPGRPDAEAAGEDRHAGRRQQATAQVGDLLPPELVLIGDGGEGVGDERVLDAVGAIEPPG